VRESGTVALAVPRVATRNTHGTGCSLSQAIAAGLAKGEDLATAVRNAKAFISAAAGRSIISIDFTSAGASFRAGLNLGLILVSIMALRPRAHDHPLLRSRSPEAFP
jgi:hydroxyethylthiazole kinase-like sugar kinase family protein